MNTVGGGLQLNGNACARAFKKAAGDRLQNMCDAEVQSHGGSIPVGEIAVTGAAALQRNGCKFVFHAICPSSQTGGVEKVCEMYRTF